MKTQILFLIFLKFILTFADVSHHISEGDEGKLSPIKPHIYEVVSGTGANLSDRKIICRKLRKLRGHDDVAFELYQKICRCKGINSSRSTSAPQTSTSSTTETETETETEPVPTTTMQRFEGTSFVHTSTLVPTTTTPYMVDPFEEMCYWCEQYCYYDFEGYQTLDANYCFDCRYHCANAGIIIRQRTTTASETFSTSTSTTRTTEFDQIEEECYWCADICDRNWEVNLHYRESFGTSYCPNCIDKCAKYGYTIVDRSIGSTTEPITTTPEITMV